jgi:hypothetical protein
MSVLNLALYRALVASFGKVIIAHEGARMDARYIRQPDGRTRLISQSSGEYYRVNCFACRDTKHRLWINHRWGIKDAQTGTKNRWLAICFNEDCLREEQNRVELIERTTWYHREAGAGRVVIRPGHVEDAGRPVPLPRDFRPLAELKPNNPVVRYLKERGFDPAEIADLWAVGYSRKEAYCLSSYGRMVIPIYRLMNGRPECWGWQARRVRGADHEPKYFTAPGLRKSSLLYGLERLESGKGPVLVCEGPTDVWRAGRDAVAVLGKHASADQVRLLARHALGRPVVVALDEDARAEAEDLAAALAETRAGSVLHPDPSPVTVLALPAGQDPADLARRDLWALIAKSVAVASRSLPTQHRNEIKNRL